MSHTLYTRKFYQIADSSKVQVTQQYFGHGFSGYKPIIIEQPKQEEPKFAPKAKIARDAIPAQKAAIDFEAIHHNKEQAEIKARNDRGAHILKVTKKSPTATVITAIAAGIQALKMPKND